MTRAAPTAPLHPLRRLVGIPDCVADITLDHEVLAGDPPAAAPTKASLTLHASLQRPCPTRLTNPFGQTARSRNDTDADS
jgi:hypothetical protein